MFHTFLSSNLSSYQEEQEHEQEQEEQEQEENFIRR